MNAPLYKTAGGEIMRSDFTQSLKALGVEEGDVLFVHSDIAAFGLLATRDRNLLFNSIVHAIEEAVGDEGTIIMPTFTYSFGRGEDGIGCRTFKYRHHHLVAFDGLSN